MSETQRVQQSEEKTSVLEDSLWLPLQIQDSALLCSLRRETLYLLGFPLTFFSENELWFASLTSITASK